MKKVLAITRKELEGYFRSPMALIFVGAFLAVTLFTFFWIDTFFARGIADVRPLFRRMPVLMIFLVAALTMRQWSEEQRSGTMEILLTLPVSKVQLVIGKFLAVMALIALALALTIFLPITVTILGNPDWGPIVGGYLAAILLAGAYTAIGLFVSSRTDNQIVALISTALICGLFYLIGSSGIADFFGDQVGEILRAIGSGSRFESIERGVVDLRDLVYYLSLTGAFLTLNVVSLDVKGWSTGERTLSYRRTTTITAALIVINLLVTNVWMFPLQGLRLDLTSQNLYTLSDTTRDLLSNLQEPLTIRGYFSEKTHPLLAPLVPGIRDMLREYEVAAGGRVNLEIVDPAQNPELEAEANQTYGIRPAPFQITGRYETSIVNSYFHILILYGDQYEVLSFEDLIEIEGQSGGAPDVRLRNLEYDLTRTIKKVVYGFQSIETVLAAMEEPAQLTLYVTPETLPEPLAEAPQTIESIAESIASEAGGNFKYAVVNPNEPDSDVTPQELYEQYGIQPLAASLFSDTSYYLHMVLEAGEESQVIYPSADLTEATIRSSIESTLKRASPGFLKVIGLWTPPAPSGQDPYAQQQSISSWSRLQQTLREEYEVRNIDLSSGTVPTEIDVLLVVAPQNLSDKGRYAIDQYLMRGGAVIVAAGNYAITVPPAGQGLALKTLENGVREMLQEYGIYVQQKLVLDPQNEPFPVPVTENVGGTPVQRIQAIDYPFFVDIRSDGMASGSPIVSNVPAVTLNWSSPITVSEETDLDVTPVLKSSSQSWTEESVNIQPNFQTYPELGFPVGDEQESHTLAVAVQGSFESAFKDEPSPFNTEESEGEEGEEQSSDSAPVTIESSPESARLFVVGSAEFVDDVVFQLSETLTRDRYLNSLKLVQNAVAWGTEDLDLLTIRSRGTHARVLAELSETEQSFWEGANYVLALLSLAVIGMIWNTRRSNEEPMDLVPQSELTSSAEVAR